MLECATGHGIGHRIHAMRLSFANGERADVVLDGGVATLGSAEGNSLLIQGRDVAPWHARLSVDARGIVLEVMQPNARTHVNARPVREKALLRCGDAVTLGSTILLLRGTSAPMAEAPTLDVDPGVTTPARVVLRGVSGRHFGRAIPVNPGLVVGTAPDCDVVVDEPRVAARHAAIELTARGLCLRNLDAREGTLVNGNRVSDAWLRAGDQVAFEQSLFVIEAPGIAVPDEAAAPAGAEDASSAGAGGVDGGSLGGIGWLLLAAGAIALAMVLLFHRGL
jgi:pSer/pThr/pTyr-binding forkhead associated (FHA) protein